MNMNTYFKNKALAFLFIPSAFLALIGSGCAARQAQPQAQVQPASVVVENHEVPQPKVPPAGVDGQLDETKQLTPSPATATTPVVQKIEQASAPATETKPAPLQAVNKTASSEPMAPNGAYTNVDGNSVPKPYQASSAPQGATARCRDGSYSFSQHRSGTCSHHGGVADWL